MNQVAKLQWPAEAAERDRLHAAGMPCLLLVAPGSDVPSTPSSIEDWAWTSAPPAEITARVASLLVASEGFIAEPQLDENGLLIYRGQRVALPPVEASLVRELLENFSLVVSRDQLSRAAWGQTPPGRNALDVHVLRIRRRIEPIGLVMRTIRSRGYLLDSAATNPRR